MHRNWWQTEILWNEKEREREKVNWASQQFTESNKYFRRWKPKSVNLVEGVLKRHSETCPPKSSLFLLIYLLMWTNGAKKNKTSGSSDANPSKPL